MFALKTAAADYLLLVAYFTTRRIVSS